MNLQDLLAKGMSKVEIAEWIKTLSEREQEAILYDWKFWARDNQLMPEEKPYLGYFYVAGRGAGKTKAGSEWVIQRARDGKGPISLIGATTPDTLDVMLARYPSSIIQSCPPSFKPKWEPSKRTFTFPNGVFGTTFSAEDPEQVRGINSATVWMDEPCKFKNAEELYDQVRMILRHGTDPRWLATSTPKPMRLMRQWTNDPKIYVVRGSTFDNKDNLPAAFLEELLDKYEGTTIGEQEIYGKILFEAEHGLFKRELIDRFRVLYAPKLDRVAIGLDPAVTANRKSNATGISCGGCVYNPNTKQDEVYVLEDATVRGAPSKWGQAVRDLMEKYGATTVVAESNQGGDLVKDVLVRYGIPDWRIKLIHAGESKYDRAIPVATEFEKGRIHHVGNAMEALEDELVAFEGRRDRRNSPDRLDAYVHCIDELILSSVNKRIIIGWGIKI